MKSRLLTATGAVALAVALPLSFGTGPASSATATTKGSPTAPCEKAKTAKLNAGFMCDLVYVPKTKTKAVIAKIEATGSMEAALAATGGEGGTCSLTGCYQWFTNIHSGYDAVGSYGWRYSSGAYQRIGEITVGIDDYLTSPYATKMAMCWNSTHAAAGVYLIGEMYYATTGGANGELSTRRKAWSGSSTVLGGVGKCYTAYVNDNTRGIYTNDHFMSWQAAGFPGKWYLYNKTWIYGKPYSNQQLRFYSPVKWPYYANEAAWQPTL